MDNESKIKALRQLSKLKGTKAESALQKEGDKIAGRLESGTQYDFIEDQIELLDNIAFRLSEKSVLILKKFLKRLRNINFTYPSVLGISEEDYKKYSNREEMTVKALNVLEHIMYHQPEDVLCIFLQYSISEDEKIRKQAFHGLKEISEYNIDIIFGNQNWGGLGLGPQEIIIEKLESLNEPELLQYFDAKITLCKNLLSPTIGGHSWDYKSVTITSGALPAKEQVVILRNKTLTFLKKCFQLELSIKQKLSLISAMQSATHPHHGHHDDSVVEMIKENILTVLTFFESIIQKENLQIVQKIEHFAYWLFYHYGGSERIGELALNIENQLENYEEYKKYKTLIGYEGIFEKWKDKREKKGEHVVSYGEREKLRLQKGKEYAEGITEDNFSEWEKRIVEYSSTESDDLATFPCFGKFLEHFCFYSPQLGLRLLRNQAEALKQFLSPIILGLWGSNTEEFRTLISGWIDEGKYLRQVARIFEFNKEFDEELLTKVLIKASAVEDKAALSQIIASTTANYDSNKKYLINKLFMPSVKALTALKEAGWIFDVWFRVDKSDVFESLEENDYEVILENLLILNSIDFHSEEILIKIAKRHPDKVINFFGQRLQKEEDGKLVSSFDAVPFDFYKLSEELSKIPEKAVQIIREWYDENNRLFRFRGARLLKIIFPTFPEVFQKQLNNLIQTGEKGNIEFVLAILRNYEGQKFLHGLCKEIIKASPEEGEFSREVMFILDSTGVVSGEYGFAEAYERKSKEVAGWLNDKNEKVTKFAENYISVLEEQIKAERLRADEEIELRKHQYGDNEDTDNN